MKGQAADAELLKEENEALEAEVHWHMKEKANLRSNMRRAVNGLRNFGKRAFEKGFSMGMDRLIYGN